MTLHEALELVTDTAEAWASSGFNPILRDECILVLDAVDIVRDNAMDI